MPNQSKNNISIQISLVDWNGNTW